MEYCEFQTATRGLSEEKKDMLTAILSDFGFESFYEENNEHNPAVPLIRYIIAVTRCDFDEFESLRQMAIGHYADEIEQIISDVEDEYLYDREFDDENV